MSKSRIVQRDLRWPMLAAALLAVVALLYSPSLAFPFLQLDDNPRLLQLDLAKLSFGWAFDNPFAWQPLTWISHQIDFRLFGFQSPRNHHWVNLLLHLANTGLFFALLAKLTGDRPATLAATALFALHPLRVESVAWISGRPELLAAFFVLLTLEAHRRGLWWAALPLGGLATLAGPAAAFLALVVLLLDRLVLRRPADWRVAGPLAALGALALFLRATGHADHETLLQLPPTASFTQGLATLAGQLLATVWPIDLTIGRAPGASLAAAGAGVAVVATLAAGFVVSPQPVVKWALAWFVAFLAPSLWLPTVWGRGDANSYLAHFGLLTALAFAVPAAWRSLAGKAAAVVAIVCLALSWVHLFHFRGSIPLLERAVTVDEANPEMRLALGLALAGQGTPRDAEKHLRYATQASPSSGLAWASLARALTAQKRVVESLAVLDTAIRQAPNSAEVLFERGIALQNLNRIPEAEKDFIEALRLGLDSRNGAIAYNNLGSYAAQRQDFPRAEKYFEQAFTLDLGFALAHKNYAMSLVAQKQRQKAIQHLERKAILWTNNNQLVGEYLASLMTEAYQEQYRKEQEVQARLEQEAERRAGRK